MDEAKLGDVISAFLCIGEVAREFLGVEISVGVEGVEEGGDWVGLSVEMDELDEDSWMVVFVLGVVEVMGACGTTGGMMSLMNTMSFNASFSSADITRNVIVSCITVLTFYYFLFPLPHIPIALDHTPTIVSLLQQVSRRTKTSATRQPPI